MDRRVCGIRWQPVVSVSVPRLPGSASLITLSSPTASWRTMTTSVPSPESSERRNIHSCLSQSLPRDVAALSGIDSAADDDIDYPDHVSASVSCGIEHSS